MANSAQDLWYDSLSNPVTPTVNVASSNKSQFAQLLNLTNATALNSTGPAISLAGGTKACRSCTLVGRCTGVILAGGAVAEGSLDNINWFNLCTAPALISGGGIIAAFFSSGPFLFCRSRISIGITGGGNISTDLYIMEE